MNSFLYVLPEKVKVLVAQSCLTLCNPTDCSSPGSSVHGILQARILERVAIPFSRGSSSPRDQTWVSSTAGRFYTIWPPGKSISIDVYTKNIFKRAWYSEINPSCILLPEPVHQFCIGAQFFLPAALLLNTSNSAIHHLNSDQEFFTFIGFVNHLTVTTLTASTAFGHSLTE